MTDPEIMEARSLWAEAWHRLRHNRLAMVCLGVISVYFALAILDFVPAFGVSRSELGTGVRGHSVIDWAFVKLVGAPDRSESFVPPLTGKHLLGTDIHGVDVLYKTVKGIRTAMIIGVLTALIYVPLGLLFGIVAGYFGGFVDDAIVYVYSTLACIPGILLLIALMAVMNKGIVQLCIALGVTNWVGLCRLVRGETLKRRESEYVLAARAVGAGRGRIIFRHIMPNLFHIVIITFTLGFSGTVMAEAVLSYIGVGVRPSTVSWGAMISNAKMELARDPSVWWHMAGAAGALFLLVLTFNVFGDALRDALDPKLRT